MILQEWDATAEPCSTQTAEARKSSLAPAQHTPALPAVVLGDHPLKIDRNRAPGISASTGHSSLWNLVTYSSEKGSVNLLPDTGRCPTPVER